MTKIGDKVRFLNAVGGGIVKRIEGKIAYVDEDGFETPVLLKEIVTVDSDRFYGKDPKPHSASAVPSKDEDDRRDVQPVAPPVPEEPVAVEETPDGDSMNIVLGYEARDVKRINSTTYDAYLVNDSNYYIFVTYMTRGDGDEGWTLRFEGIIEPNIQEYLGEVTRDELTKMDRISVQYVAFKRGKEFALKSPVGIERSLDNTKFFKVHCFHANPYFEKPVIAIDIVKDDVAQRSFVIDSSRLEEGMRRKAKDVRSGMPSHRQSRPMRPSVIEVDLHINELLDSTAGLSHSDMLEAQLREARRVLDENMRFKGQKIVLIHGKGEGVLRKAVLDMLAREYKHCDVQDASFREYGFGATQVTIR